MTESTGVGKGNVKMTNHQAELILDKQEWKCDLCHEEIKEYDHAGREKSLYSIWHHTNLKKIVDEWYLVNRENVNPRRKPKNRQSTPGKDLNSNTKTHGYYILLCARCNKISLKNDQINIRISNYQKKVLQNIAAEDNQSVADYIYNLLDSKMKEDEDTKSRWLNKDK